MSSIIRLSLRPEADAKVTPVEVLQDFGDVTAGWSYLDEDSRHYAELKGSPGVILRHRADPSTYVDLGFVETDAGPHTVELVVLDRPGAEAPLASGKRRSLVESFSEALRSYLSHRPDHVTLHLNRDAADSASP